MAIKPKFSFEFFPPRDEKAKVRLWDSLLALSALEPCFVSITYGAGGTTRANTHKVVLRVVKETRLEIAAHLTSVGQSKEELLAIARDYWQAGVRHLVLLRGDMPEQKPYQQHPQGFRSTPEFISAVRALADFEISVSAYPEKHPESPSHKADLLLLKQKQDAGAHRAISQFCFDDEAFLRLRDEAVAQGIEIPIVPGIIQTTNFKGIAAMAHKSGARVPHRIVAAFDKAGESIEARRALAIDIALKQCENFLTNGVEHFHFYTLNQTKVTQAVCSALTSLSIADERGAK